MYFCCVVRNHVSRVVHTSENAVYKSAIKNIKPRILHFLKRGKPSVHNYSLKRAEFSFCVRIKTSLKPRNFTFKTSEILIFWVEKVFYCLWPLKRIFSKTNFISFHYTS